MAGSQARFSHIGVDPDNPVCFLCLAPASFRCQHCDLPYCSPSHLAVHRPRDYCYPFRVLQKPQVGRYVVATRDLNPLELILEDDPAVVGPNHDTPPVCLECLLPVDGSYLCQLCQLPLCGDQCSGGPHHQAECSIFQDLPSGYQLRVCFDRKMTEGGTRPIAPEYGCIAPLRLLSLKSRDPDMWSRLKLLMDHDQERRQEEDYQQMFQVNVVDFLRKVCGLQFSEDEIFWAIGLLRTNAFYIDDPKMKKFNTNGKALFPTFSYLSHSCICNARYCVEPYSNRLSLRAQVPIAQGEEVTIQYISFMYGNLRRKKDIQSYWFFECRCRRCLDQTEMGSMMSAMRCSDCEHGHLLPQSATDLNSDWICSSCLHKQSVGSVEDYIRECEDKLFDIYEHNVAKYEQTLEEFLARLHSNHYLVLTVKKYLADLYGSVPGYQFSQLSDENLQRKIQFCQDFMSTIGLVDPGCSRWRGSVQFELHRALMVKMNKQFSQGLISKKQFVESLKDISQIVQDSYQGLRFEPQGTKEALIAKMAQKALTQIKEVIQFSDFL